MAPSMAPPTPKEPRRSNRRSAHSSTSTSKSSGSPSPDASSLPPPTKEPDARSAASSSNSTAARSKRTKDDNDDYSAASTSNHRKTASVASAANPPQSAPAPKRTKRKGKEPVVSVDNVTDSVPVEPADPQVTAAGEKTGEDAGITRCVCEGLADDDGDAAEFMVQCETCMAWQHGPCMGFAEENEIPEGDYYCERCKPEDHVELLKKLQRRQRQSSEKSLHTHQSRNSRSHSPTHFLKTAKRRNTMNSRDAAYDERIQELLDATAAATTPDGETAGKDRAGSVAKTEEIFEDISEIGPGGRKKRKRVDDDALSAKRKRSTSVISERVISAATAADKLDIPAQVTTVLLPPPPAPTSNKSRVRRAGGRKSAAAQEVSVNGDGEEGATTKKHPNQYTYRVKPGTNAHSRRAPQSAVGQHQQNAVTHDHGTRRNAGNANNPGGAPGSGSRGAHNAYYNNMQLPMFTSWNLPDYLAHLQSILPSDMPPPLQIRGATSFFREDVRAGSPGPGSTDNAGAGSGEIADTQSEKMASALANATESLTERGVKVKWPAKRMSVADMNKRVRALVEWVGREQALALDRERRKAALENALRAHQQQHTVSAAEEGRREGTVESPVGSNTSMVVDGASPVETPIQEKPVSVAATRGVPDPASVLTKLGPDSTAPRPPFMFGLTLGASTRPSTTKMMEELMRELISFQERFGPGSKGAAKERTGRTALS